VAAQLAAFQEGLSSMMMMMMIQFNELHILSVSAVIPTIITTNLNKIGYVCVRLNFLEFIHCPLLKYVLLFLLFIASILST
jgi:hypothetical protein